MRSLVVKIIFLWLTTSSLPFLAYASIAADNANTQPNSTLFDANSEKWQFSSNKNGVEIHTRKAPNSEYKAFKATTIISAPVADVLAVIADAASCPLWVENCEKSDTVSIKSFGDRYGYAINNLPWPFKDRYVIVHIVTKQAEPENDIIISMTAVTKAESSKLPAQALSELEESGNVRIQISRSKYTLESIEGEKTKVTWIQHADPEGSLPSWLVNLMITDLPINSLSNLHNVAQLDRYKNAQLIYNELKQLNGLKLSNGEYINSAP